MVMMQRTMIGIMRSVDTGLAELAIMRGMRCCDGVEDLASAILATIDGVRDMQAAQQVLMERAARLDARVRALRRRRATRMDRS
jgi:hypothetical protein